MSPTQKFQFVVLYVPKLRDGKGTSGFTLSEENLLHNLLHALKKISVHQGY